MNPLSMLCRHARVAAIVFTAATANTLAADPLPTSLSNYYIRYAYVGERNDDFASRAPLTKYPPKINKGWARTGYETGEFISRAGPVDYALRADYTGSIFLPFKLGFYGSLGFPCRTDPLYVPLDVKGGDVVVDRSEWRGPGPELCGYNYFVGPSGVNWTFTDVVTFGAPSRRTSVDGGEYDASAMVIVRNGAPWTTYFWGYRLGLVASANSWKSSSLPSVPELATWINFPTDNDNFELTTLPPPWVETDVVEYVNTLDFPKQPQGQYFYAASDADKAALDAIAAWKRTGKQFKSGGYVSACRFYGGKNGGPNTHFYSADDKECTALKKIALLEYEGQSFSVNRPLQSANASSPIECPNASKPLYRLYNNASAGSAFVSNHRYVTDRADVNAATAVGWIDEGMVMCVPI
jgi:hypothetical protein